MVGTSGVVYDDPSGASVQSKGSGSVEGPPAALTISLDVGESARSFSLSSSSLPPPFWALPQLKLS